MSLVAILDETIETVVVTLPGAVGVSWLLDGAATSYVTSARQSRTDGVTVMPDLATVRGTLTGGGAAIDNTIATLRRLRDSGSTVTIQRPGRAPIASMQIERISTEEGITNGAEFSIDLKQRRTARSREVTLADQAPPAATQGPPREDIAAGQAETEQAGERPVSVLARGWDRLTGVLQ